MNGWRRSVSRLAGELAWQARRAAGAIGRAVGDPYHVVGYRGYGTATRALVLGRALQDKSIRAPDREHSRLSNLVSTIKRLESDPLPFARVKVSAGETSRVVVADDEGFLRAWISMDGRPALGNWREVRLELLDQPDHAPPHLHPVSTSPVLIPPAHARFGVISDIDDTVIQSEVTNFLRAAQIVLLENALTRLPFPGVAAFYRALVAGGGGSEENPLFYVSSSPWNLYDVVEGFLEAQSIPPGPLLLRDWDLSPSIGEHGTHKSAAIHQILETYPSLPFILIGDSSQEDPEIYSSVVHEYPARVLAVYIRNVTPHPERLARIRELAAEVEKAGSALVLADNTLAAAQHGMERGFIAASTLAEIGDERAADEGRGDAKEDSPGVETEHAPTVVVDPETR